MDLSPAESELFYDAVDDCYGLWEAIMGMKNVFPEHDEKQLRDTAERTLRSLLSKGLIQLCRRIAFEPHFTPLEPRDSDTMLSDPESWNIPSFGEIEVCYIATDQGTLAGKNKKVNV